MILIIFNITATMLLSLFIGTIFCTQWSLIKKLAIGYTLLFSINIIAGYLLDFLSISIGQGVFSIIYLLLLIGVIIYLHRNNILAIKSIITWQKSDLVVLIGATILVGLIFVPVARSKSGILNLKTPGGEDMVNHFFLVNAINQKGKYIYHDKSENNKIPKGLEDYPQGTHYNIAIILGGQNNLNIRSLLSIFKSYYLVSFILLFVLFIFAALDIIKNSESLSFLSYAAIVLFSLLIFSSTLFASSYLHGFISQIIALALLITLILIINSKKSMNKPLWLISVVLINASIAGSWFFLSPIALTLSYIAIFQSKYKYSWLAYILSLLVIIPPVYYSVTSGSLSSINAAGGIDQIPLEYIGLFIVGFIACVWGYRHLKVIELNKWLQLLIIASIFSLAMMVYQVLLSHTVSYYFYKSLYTPVMTLAVFFTVANIVIVYSVKEHFGKNHWLYSWLVITSGFIIVGGSMLYRINTQSLALGIVSNGQYINSSDFSRLEKIALENKNSNNNQHYHSND